MAKLDENGHEVLDSTPVAATIKIAPRYNMFDRMRDMIRRELSEQAADKGLETWEEANDFDVGDDFDPSTPYEEQFDPETGDSKWDIPVHSEQEAPLDQKKPKSKGSKQGDGDDDPHDGLDPSIDKDVK